MGAEAAALHLVNTEDYANCFFINNTDGSFTVTRTRTGLLHTDGQGNYSSIPFGSINTPVTIGVHDHKPMVEKRYISAASWLNTLPEYSEYDSDPGEPPSSQADFIDWVLDNEYDIEISDAVFNKFNLEQLDWYDALVYKPYNRAV